MENSLNTNASAPVTPVELTQRQIRDWKTLQADLEKKNEQEGDHERYNQIEYCKAKIDELESDLVMLTGADA